MKSLSFMVAVIIFGSAVMNDAYAQGEGKVLCRMLESSLASPWEFDSVVSEERHRFGGAMNRFLKAHLSQLTTQAKNRESVCEPYKNKSMGYDICMGNNPARELVSWLESVSQAVKGSKWEQTDYGEGQLKVWNSCDNPAFCEQLRLAAAHNSRQQCPQWLIN